MMYKIIYSQKAEEDLARLLKDEQPAYKKALKLIAELYDHPRTGTGHPEPLKGRPNQWSRHIT
jgi:toxin YoeB